MKRIISLIVSITMIFSLFSAIPVQAAESQYLWPVLGHYLITSSFGYRDLDELSYNGREDYHAAIDINDRRIKGANVYATKSGYAYYKWVNGAGHCVYINHKDGTSSRYAHLIEKPSNLPRNVVQGEKIANVGNTGGKYAYHLDFRISNGTGASSKNAFNNMPRDASKHTYNNFSGDKTYALPYLYDSGLYNKTEESIPTHTHVFQDAYESKHPHAEYKKCNCGVTSYTGEYTAIQTCQQCYPVGNISLTRTFEKTKGTATFYRNNVNNATSYTLKLYKNNSLYNTYTMSSDEYYVSGLPSGEYYAVLYAKNTSTGQEGSDRCDSFKIADSYTVSYNANGGTGEPSSQTKIEDTTLTLSSVVPTKEGHIFKGWASSKNAIQPQYIAGGSYTKNTKITLYAVWEPETYTVNFDVNGGIGATESETVVYGNTLKMPNSAVKDYAYLIGWSTDKNATEPEYKLGVDYKIKSNLTLYAVWGKATWGGEVSAKLSGNGTEESPYLISTAADLAYLANKVNTQTEAPKYEYYKLTDNINLTYTEWLPIGIYNNKNQYFCGSFDGNGYTISDLYITKENQGYIGLFGHVKDSDIKNLTITGAIENISSSNKLNIGGIIGYADNSSIDGLSSKYFNIGSIGVGTADYSAIGTVVGKTNSGTIDSCESYNSSINLKSGRFSSGMIAGYCDSDITGCKVESTEGGLFSASATVSVFYIGGICGMLTKNADKCSVKAPYFADEINAVTEIAGLLNIGGIVGYTAGNISLCSVKFFDGPTKTIDKNIYSSSVLASSRYAINIGGIAGFMEKYSTVTGCIYDGQSISSVASKYHSATGGIVGYAEVAGNGDLIIKSIANIDGIVYAESENSNSHVGTLIGVGQDTTVNEGASIKNTISMANRIKSVGCLASNAGYVIGDNWAEMLLEKVYYNSEITYDAITDTTGTARPQKTMNVAFYTNLLGLTPYTSLENIKTDESAVWILENGELPELYYNCLNDIIISKDIENGTISVDKPQAVDGEVVTVTATPNENYVLNKIYVNGSEIDGATFTVSGDSEVYATFSEKIAEYSVEISASENASGMLVNLDNAQPMLMALSDETMLVANDGEEIQVNISADIDYAVDAVYVNGEEIASDSFIITDNSVVTMDIVSISTKISAITNDPVEIGCDYAVLSGTTDGNLSYIRYWKTDEPNNVITTAIEENALEYVVTLPLLEIGVSYSYQMTENGEVKTFVTQSENGNFENDDLTDVETEMPITTTTYKKLIATNKYKFTITSEKVLSEKVYVAAYSEGGRLLSIAEAAFDGDVETTASIPALAEISYVKIFVWDEQLKPTAVPERIEITE